MRMMKYIPVSALFLMVVLCTSCEGQNKPEAQKDNIQSESNDVVTSTGSNGSYHTQYAYTDSDRRRLIIQNSYPRGELYTGPDGQQYTKVIFWTRIINETNNALKLAIDFSGDAYEIPGSVESSVVRYCKCKLIIPPDTMTSDKEGLRNYGLNFDPTDFGKPSSLNRTVDPNDSSGFFVIKLYKVSEEDRALVKRGGGGATRAGFSIKGQDVFWTLNGKAFLCGKINLNLK
jgi:hypothetical protein